MAELKRAGRQGLSLLNGQDTWLASGYGNDDSDQIRADGLALIGACGLPCRLRSLVLHRVRRVRKTTRLGQAIRAKVNCRTLPVNVHHADPNRGFRPPSSLHLGGIEAIDPEIIERLAAPAVLGRANRLAEGNKQRISATHLPRTRKHLSGQVGRSVKQCPKEPSCPCRVCPVRDFASQMWRQSEDASVGS